MSLFIPLHTKILTEPKILRLCKLLGKNRPDDRDLIRAKIENLWLWAVEHCQDGDIGDYSSAEIAEFCHYRGNSDKWLNSLIECGTNSEPGFLERTEDGRLTIHNWEIYGGKIIKERERISAKQKRYRYRNRYGDVTGNVTGDVTPQIRLDKNIYTPLTPQGDDAAMQKPARGEKKLASSQAEQIYFLYPRKAGKGAALKSIEKALKIVDFETLMEAVREYAGSEYVRTAPPALIPHPSTWFNQSRWEDDRSEWNRPYDVSRRNGKASEPDFDSYLPPPRNPTPEDLALAYGETTK
jgi:hypothetical protein